MKKACTKTSVGLLSGGPLSVKELLENIEGLASSVNIRPLEVIPQKAEKNPTIKTPLRPPFCKELLQKSSSL